MKDIESKKRELISKLHKLFEGIGYKRPRTIDAQNDIGGPNYMTYVSYFGSWENALRQAEVNKDMSKKEFLVIKKKFNIKR